MLVHYMKGNYYMRMVRSSEIYPLIPCNIMTALKQAAYMFLHSI